MIGAWKRQAIDSMASLFDGGDQAARASSEAEIKKLHAKIGQLLVERVFWHEPPVDEHGPEAKDGRAGQPDLSITAQCRLLSISRSGYYYTPAPENGATLALMAVIDQVFLDCPWYGSRQMACHLQRMGHAVGRRRVRRLMTKMGLAAIYQRPRTSNPHPEHRIYPYFLRDLAIVRPNQVWCADVTYLPMRRGFSIWWRSWTGRRVKYWPGASRTRWMPGSALRLCRTPWPVMASKSSIPIR
jgi:hypothetical protein